MTLTDGPIFTQGLVLPDESTRDLLPNDLAEMFDIFADLEANVTSAIEGANAAGVSARQDYDNAKTDLANLEAHPESSKRRIAAAMEKVDRTRKRLDQNAADVTGLIQKRTPIMTVARACTRRVEGAQTYAPMPKTAGEYQAIAERGRLAGFSFGRVLIDPPKGDPVAEAREIQAEVGRVLGGRTRIVGASFSRDLIERQLIGDVDTAAERGDIAIDIGCDGLGDAPARHPRVIWPTVALRTPSSPDGSRVMTVDVEALVCRLHRDALVAEIRAKLDARYADVPLTLDPHEKARKLGEIDVKLLELERVEAACIWKAIRDGADIFFRPDTNPDAILGIV